MMKLKSSDTNKEEEKARFKNKNQQMKIPFKVLKLRINKNNIRKKGATFRLPTIIKQR